MASSTAARWFPAETISSLLFFIAAGLLLLILRVGLGDDTVPTYLLVAIVTVRFSSFPCHKSNNEDGEEEAVEAERGGGGEQQANNMQYEGVDSGTPLLVHREGEENWCPDGEAEATRNSVSDSADSRGGIPVPSSSSSPSSARSCYYLWLDHLKIWLTALVVTHHVGCAFGACGRAGWFLMVDQQQQRDDDNGGGDGPAFLLSSFFSRFLLTLSVLDQAFFMPLFFFISAYFAPSSLNRRSRQQQRQISSSGSGSSLNSFSHFVAKKRRRLLLPALFCMLVLVPACIVFSAYVAGTQSWMYWPVPGHAWFIFWLLLFHWMYLSISQANTSAAATVENNYDDNGGNDDNNINANSEEQQQEEGGGEDRDGNGINHHTNRGKMALPSTWKRLVCGVSICGLLSIPIMMIAPGSFASMPITIGSLPCDLLMFYLGILAKQNGWLETNLIRQLDISPMLLAALVVGEIVGLTILLPVAADGTWHGLVFVLIAGIFCLDMSLSALIVFQKHGNAETRLSTILARAAYGVYIVHPLVVCFVTAAYIRAYNFFCAADPIIFDPPDDSRFAVPGTGGGPYFAIIGWIFVNSATQLIVWPLAYALTRLPYLRNTI